jgi:hypothetical protein
MRIGRNTQNDRDIINKLKRAGDAKRYYLNLILNDANLRITINELISELRRRPIPNATRLNDNNWIGRDGVIQDENDWENLVEYWYRVRNNLLYGHKAPGLERDRRLVTYAYQTLTPLMEYFIKHSLLWEFD